MVCFVSLGRRIAHKTYGLSAGELYIIKLLQWQRLSTLLSSNPFDITGARSVGMSAVWINRAGSKWVDYLTDKRPTKIVGSLTDLSSLWH
jgi:hypothetical protein